jgi:hypothetical protein
MSSFVNFPKISRLAHHLLVASGYGVVSSSQEVVMIYADQTTPPEYHAEVESALDELQGVGYLVVVRRDGYLYTVRLTDAGIAFLQANPFHLA